MPNKELLTDGGKHWAFSLEFLGYGLNDLGFEFGQEEEVSLSPKRPQLFSGPQRPIKWVPGALFPGIKWPESETDHSPQSKAEVKNVWVYTSTHPVLVRGMCTDNFTRKDLLAGDK
jgi:hypothetical protein